MLLVTQTQFFFFSFVEIVNKNLNNEKHVINVVNGICVKTWAIYRFRLCVWGCGCGRGLNLCKLMINFQLNVSKSILIEILIEKLIWAIRSTFFAEFNLFKFSQTSMWRLFSITLKHIVLIFQNSVHSECFQSLPLRKPAKEMKQQSATIAILTNETKWIHFNLTWTWAFRLISMKIKKKKE